LKLGASSASIAVFRKSNDLSYFCVYIKGKASDKRQRRRDRSTSGRGDVANSPIWPRWVRLTLVKCRTNGVDAVSRVVIDFVDGIVADTVEPSGKFRRPNPQQYVNALLASRFDVANAMARANLNLLNTSGCQSAGSFFVAHAQEVTNLAQTLLRRLGVGVRAASHRLANFGDASLEDGVGVRVLSSGGLAAETQYGRA
jgi:hypothetical protein